MKRTWEAIRRRVMPGSIRQARGAARLAAQVGDSWTVLHTAETAALEAMAAELRRVVASRPADERASEALALGCEAALRTLALEPDPTQILAAIYLRGRHVVEMATGEGKTLVAALAAAAGVISGRHVHIVTANDYLAQRDAAWMGPLYRCLGLTVGCRIRGQSHAERRATHTCDIIYGTAGEFSFDYLTDGLRRDKDGAVSRAFDRAIIDEVDHILLDDATNPLVISADVPADEAMCQAANEFVAALRPEHLIIDDVRREAALSDAGVHYAESWFAERGLLGKSSLFDVSNLPTVNRIWQALRAHHIMLRDREYVVQNGAVVLLDPRTGRLTRGRLSGGLHQAIEAREGVPLSPETRPVAAQNMRAFAGLYSQLSAMTGTALADAPEFAQVYGLEVVPIASAVPSKRIDRPDRIFATARDRDSAILRLVKDRHDRGQPILIGTMTIARSDDLSTMLTSRKIAHQVLHAHFTAQEAAIVAEAGRIGAVTVATNMAGRGTDIMLGGSLCSHGENPRTHAAERVAVVAAGGLLVIGSGRQRLRRLDDQLRGRAGRRGDPGESIFLVSLEDELFDPIRGVGLEALARQSARETDGHLAEPKLPALVEAVQSRNRIKEEAARNNARRYDEIVEKQWQVIWRLRESILLPRDSRRADIVEAERAAAELCGLDSASTARVLLLSESKARAALNCLLDVIDADWQEHVTVLDELRHGIGWRSLAGRDPLTEYANEALARFRSMLDRIRAAGRTALTDTTK